MKEWIARFKDIEKAISQEKGEFSLYALFRREDAPETWDLLVAAPWIEENRQDALTYIVKQLQEEFLPNELTPLSRVVLIYEDNPGLAQISRTVQVNHGLAEVQNRDFFGLPIKDAYFVTAGPVLSLVTR